jgi:hypothetical protein
MNTVEKEIRDTWILYRWTLTDIVNIPIVCRKYDTAHKATIDPLSVKNVSIMKRISCFYL